MKEMFKLINTEAEYTMGKFTITVIIDDVRNVWGHDQVLITPKLGKGAQWVRLESVKLCAD